MTFACPFRRKYPLPSQKDDLFFMSMAYNEAITAWEEEEVPIGAVIVREQEVIASAHNLAETRKEATAHAEILAMAQASRFLGDWRLNESILYVTKEPCPMCAGAAILSRVGEIVFGFSDEKMGCLGGKLALHQLLTWNHHPRVRFGIMSEECYELVRVFFEKRRKKDDNISNTTMTH
jgi:tRNA(adenine34) deaminase